MNIAVVKHSRKGGRKNNAWFTDAHRFEFYDFIKLQTTHKVVRTKGLSNAHMNNRV